MPYIEQLFTKNFLEYASYVIKDRAIPYLEDGLKPVQRRILHSLFEMDDGRFNKVANVVGHCMKYHPHGDASIYSALVVLANKDLFIEKQGNFGNIFTGDPPSAARYIECRLLPLAKEILYNSELTAFADSYDGRNKEPVTYPAKLPIVLIQGAEGIAVGMSTKILPHNFNEVLLAVRANLEGEQSQLFPDFPTGGYLDVSEYDDGNGKVKVRAKLDTKDSKRIIVREIPYGTTTEGLIASIEKASKQNKIKVSSISDYSTDKVEIEIKLARGVHSRDVIKGLYAFTDCESSISVNLLLIKEDRPVNLTVCELINYFGSRLKEILKLELENERNHLLDNLHAKTLEQIFIEERIYKKIEQMKTKDTVIKSVINGFVPFTDQIQRNVTRKDVERLLTIPIRRISLYDINKAKHEMAQINKRLNEIKHHLKYLTKYAISYVDNILEKYGENFIRKTEIMSFDMVEFKEAAQRNLKLKYDANTGYLGTEVNSGKVEFDVSLYDKILVIKKSGLYTISEVTKKTFVDKGMLYCGLMDGKDENQRVFTVIYRKDDNKHVYIKRCKIIKFIMNKGYSLIPDKCTLLKITLEENCKVVLNYKPKPRLKILVEEFDIREYKEKGVKAQGVRLSNKETKSVKFIKNLEELQLSDEQPLPIF